MRIGLALGILSLLAWEAWAHHSFNFFRSEEGDRFVIAEGTLREIKLANPHSGVFIDVVNEAGETEVWGLESRPFIFLSRRGWTQDTLEAGQKVTFAGERLREPNQAWWRALLVHGATPDADAQLFIELEALDELERAAFESRFAALPACETVNELCYRLSPRAMQEFQTEFGGDDYLAPGPE